MIPAAIGSFCREGLPADNRHSNRYKLFLFSHQHLSVFILSGIHKVLAIKGKETAFRFDDVFSINNHDFENYLGQMYPVELEIQDTTESITSVSYLDLLLSIRRDCQLYT